MKSFVLIFLSLLLASAILTPSIMTLVDLDEKTNIAIDFNEEEKKEEKKESSEKDFLFSSGGDLLSCLEQEKNLISEFYVESNYAICVAIFLLPPQQSLC